MLRVPPAPAPQRSIAACIAASTAGCWPCRDSRWSTTRPLAAAPPVVVHRPREIPGSAFEVGKDAIASLAPQLTKLLLEKGFVIHHAPLSAADRDAGREDEQAADYDLKRR